MPGCFDESYALPQSPWQHSRNLLCSIDTHLLYCDPNTQLKYISPIDKTSYPLNCCLNSTGDDFVRSEQCQGLPFQVRQLIPNATGQCILALGERDLVLVELPPVANVKAGQCNHCRVRSIASHYFARDSTLRLVVAQWHPLSLRHVVVLTSDNQLSIYNTSKDFNEPEQAIKLRSAYANTGALQGYQLYEHNSEPENRVVGFSFLSGLGWNPFMILYATASGDIYLLGPVVPFNCLMQSELFDGLPLPGGTGGHLDSSSSDPAAEHPLRLLRDSWVSAITKQDTTRIQGRLGAHVCMTNEMPSQTAAQYAIPLGPINQEGDPEPSECTSIQVMPVDPPVVALGFASPLVKLYTLVRTTFPKWLLDEAEEIADRSFEVLQLFEVIQLHTEAAPEVTPAPHFATDLQPDPMRPDRIFCSHHSEGLFIVQLPSFFLPGLHDRPLPLTGTTVLALEIAGGGTWPTMLGQAVLHFEPESPAQMGSWLYTLSAQSLTGREYRITLQSTDLGNQSLATAIKSLVDRKGTEESSKQEDIKSELRAKVQQLGAAIEKAYPAGYMPSVGRPLQPTAQQEEEWEDLFKKMMESIQRDRVEKLQELMKQVDALELETQQVIQGSEADLRQLQTKVQQFPDRQARLKERLAKLLTEQQCLLEKNQKLVELVMLKARGKTSEQQQKFCSQIDTVNKKFIPWCEAKLKDADTLLQAQPDPEEVTAIYFPKLADVEQVAKGTMELIVACKALSIELRSTVEP